MAEFDPAFWTNANAKRAQINTAEAERSAGQFFATRDARNSGMGFMDSMREGMKNREAVFDPMFELKKKQMEAQILGTAAQMADHIRSLEIKKQQMADEQEDNNALAGLSKFKTWDEKARALAEITPKSARGIQQVTQLRLQLAQLKSMDAASRAVMKMTPQQLAAVNRYEQGSDEWWAAVDKTKSAGETFAETRNLIKRLDALDPEDRVRIEGMSDREQQLQAIGLAEEALQVRKANQTEQQRMDAEAAKVAAEASGMVPTVTISGNKVTERFTTPPEKKDGGAYSEPTIKDIAGIPHLFYRNFAPKRLDKLSPKQQEKIKVASAQVRALGKEAASDPKNELLKQQYEGAKADLDRLFDEPAATAPKASTQKALPLAAQKAAEANKIAGENPGWTREQIIREVEARFAR